jgi:hypothetical protein
VWQQLDAVSSSALGLLRNRDAFMAGIAGCEGLTALMTSRRSIPDGGYLGLVLVAAGTVVVMLVLLVAVAVDVGLR